MTMRGRVHTNRDRAEAFGAVADTYERYRPSYPARLIDDLVAARPRVALDIGCGTGKAARLVQARGTRVVGVEPDAEMARVAGANGVDVEVASFEDWDARNRSFELILSGQAWHWVDPVRGVPKAVGLLAPGGLLGLFWNYDDLDANAQQVVDGVYARHAPQLHNPVSDREDELDGFVADLKEYGGVRKATTRVYRWERTESVAAWVARMGTHSDHLLLGRDRLLEVQSELLAALGAVGDELVLRGGTYAVLARAPF